VRSLYTVCASCICRRDSHDVTVPQVSALERILTRVALTEDSQLEGVLSKLLPRVIEKLSTPHARVRQVRLCAEHTTERRCSVLLAYFAFSGGRC
jgi:Proteasome stabiliser